MSVSCRIGLHHWRIVRGHHRPCEHRNREFGWSSQRCARCNAWRGSTLPSFERTWCTCDEVRLRRSLTAGGTTP